MEQSGPKRIWTVSLDERISKRVIPIKDIVRMIIKSAAETGTPFTFNRDHVNRANPNRHKGIIYCSNLCTEIAQNMSASGQTEQKIEMISGEEVVVTVTKPGDFVVCNLASLSLGNLCVTDYERAVLRHRECGKSPGQCDRPELFSRTLCRDQQQKIPPRGTRGQRISPHAGKA